MEVSKVKLTSSYSNNACADCNLECFNMGYKKKMYSIITMQVGSYQAVGRRKNLCIFHTLAAVSITEPLIL